MRNVAISVGVLVLALAIWVATRKPLSIDEELGKLPPDERQALEAIASAAGVTANQLRPVGPGVLEYNPKAVAISEGHIVELRIADAPIQNLDAVSRMVGLRALWLDGTQLASLKGIGSLSALKTLNVSRTPLQSAAELAGHPALVRVNLSKCALSSVAELRDLPNLTTLDLGGNKLTDVSALTSLPQLSELDLTGNPLTALPSPVPSRWKVKSDVAAAAPAGSSVAKPANWVDQRPNAKGEAQKLSFKGYVSPKADTSVDGKIDSLKGGVLVSGIASVGKASGDNMRLEIEVQSGRVRGYLAHSFSDSTAPLGRRHGYVFGEATPGKPGYVVGMLPQLPGYNQNQPFEFVIESVDGEATGITFKLHRNPATAPAASPVNKSANWVDKLPKPTVDPKLGSISGMVTNKTWEVTGSVPVLSGVAKINRIPGIEEAAGGDTTLELEVDHGQVRAYLESAIADPSSLLGRKVGYIYVDAAPGKPGKLVGTLRSFGPGNYGMARAYELTVESIGGEASGIRYKLYHR